MRQPCALHVGTTPSAKSVRGGHPCPPPLTWILGMQNKYEALITSNNIPNKKQLQKRRTRVSAPQVGKKRCRFPGTMSWLNLVEELTCRPAFRLRQTPAGPRSGPAAPWEALQQPRHDAPAAWEPSRSQLP